MTKKERIEQLKKDKDAVILAHYYVDDEVQDVADYIGDSYYLSKKAVALKNKTIVFAGVSFMGESAKILNSKKTVLMPDVEADCPMAHMVTKEIVEKARDKYEDLAVVCYINSTAEIKSWSDVCVTSANAVNIVRNLPNRYILFIPDKNLAHYVAEQVPEKKFIFNNGFCPVHEKMKAKEVKDLKKEHPDAKILSHPECNKEILNMSDYIGSTSGIIDYCDKDDWKEYIICTEIGVSHALRTVRPDAKFYFTKTKPICHDMKKNTLDKIIKVLEEKTNVVELPKASIEKGAKDTLDRMLDLASK